MRAEGFTPVAQPDARVLVLGTLPGPESLRQRQYYGQPRNVFWRVMGELVGAGPERPYPRRLKMLVEHRIALWDVCAAAERVGALDAAIRGASVEPNDFAGFFRRHPQIQLICFNGQTAATLYRRHVIPNLAAEFAGIEQRVLPSTSPAHAAMSFERKLERWRVVAATTQPAPGA
jgi:hypoxanthine-DNA glycosylase